MDSVRRVSDGAEDPWREHGNLNQFLALRRIPMDREPGELQSWCIKWT